jgi:hypothetical protein
MEKLLICIPFTGFYESVHNSFIDDSINDLFSDKETGNPLDIPDAFYMTNYCPQETRIEYAREYVKAFQEWLETELELKIGLEFESLSSPKYYNFETDRIFARIDIQDAQTLYDHANGLTLKDVIERRHTSRSGFISFYPNDIAQWGGKNITAYDHNELETILIAAIETIGNDSIDELLSDYDLMEYARCNGVIDDIVWSNMPDNAKAIVNEFEEKQESAA